MRSLSSSFLSRDESSVQFYVPMLLLSYKHFQYVQNIYPVKPLR